jgi:hypothetical protein
MSFGIVFMNGRYVVDRMAYIEPDNPTSIHGTSDPSTDDSVTDPSTDNSNHKQTIKWISQPVL